MNRFPLATRLALSAAGLLLAAATASAQTAQPMQPAPSNQAAPSATRPSASTDTQPSASTGTQPCASTGTQPSASTETRLHEADQAFIADGTKGVSTQRDAARIANSRSSDSQVKAFAERVVVDNTKITDAMRAASPRGVDVPRNDPDTAVLDAIKNLRGDAFDKAYIEQVALNGQQKTLSAFQAEIASGRDQKLTSVARQALPILQAHYAQAQKLAQRKHLTSAQ